MLKPRFNKIIEVETILFFFFILPIIFAGVVLITQIFKLLDGSYSRTLASFTMVETI